MHSSAGAKEDHEILAQDIYFQELSRWRGFQSDASYWIVRLMSCEQTAVLWLRTENTWNYFGI